MAIIIKEIVIKKILRVIVSMDPALGGPSLGIRISIPVMADLGVENEVICLDDPECEFLGKDKFPIHALGPGIKPYLYTPKLESWLLANLNRFDIVIIHGLWFYHSYGTYKTWKKFTKANSNFPKLYIMPHGMLHPHFQISKGRRLKALRQNVIWRLFDRKVVNGANGVLFTCERELELAKDAFQPYAPKEELNVGYGVSPPPAFRSNMVLEFQKKCPSMVENGYWLYLSRIHPKKGLDLLINSYLQLRKENYKLPDLVIAGSGLNSAFGKKLQEIAASERHIHFPGFLQGEAKYGAFYGCEAFVLPSQQENFGITVVEALACSKPVLITPQVNVYREIEKGGGGLVGEDSENGVYTMLKKWLDLTDPQRQEMGKNAFKVFENNYNVHQATGKMLDLLNPAST
ncbi:MAG: glycosyltransferase [Cyclobacteriaceae bacterium]